MEKMKVLFPWASPRQIKLRENSSQRYVLNVILKSGIIYWIFDLLKPFSSFKEGGDKRTRRTETMDLSININLQDLEYHALKQKLSKQRGGQREQHGQSHIYNFLQTLEHCDDKRIEWVHDPFPYKNQSWWRRERRVYLPWILVALACNPHTCMEGLCLEKAMLPQHIRNLRCSYLQYNINYGGAWRPVP